MAVLIFNPALSGAQDETLYLLEGGKDESITSSRAPKPLSMSAENITIITSEEISLLNAHTLADILSTVSGVQFQSLRTPGSVDYLRLQGALYNHILVMVDNVPINNLGDRFPDTGLIPARIIDRVEIVKGAASSTWGQALGGVINVITKNPRDQVRTVGGMISTSAGEHSTRDTGAELAGTVNRFGYYLSGGYLTSDGLLQNNQIHLSNAYAKLTMDLPGQLSATATFASSGGKRGDLAYPIMNIKEDSSPTTTYTTLTIRKRFSERLDAELSGRYSLNKFDIAIQRISNSFLLQKITSNEANTGLQGKIAWRGAGNLLALGVDYENVRMHQNDSILQVDRLRSREDRWGIYLNDTLSLGDFAVSPGVRYDETGRGEQFSPSLGITWQISENNLLRAYTSRGYSLPSLYLNEQSEKVWTTQLGFESSVISNLWFKTTLFRNETRDILSFDSRTRSQRLDKQVKQGAELEFKTTPWFNTSFSGGYTYLDARDRETGDVVPDTPSQTIQLAVRYDDQRYLKSSLNGRHIWWNADPSRHGSYHGMIWDLFFTVFPFDRGQDSPELYFSLRNIFNGRQYLLDVFPNTNRWGEIGVRYRF